MSVSEAGTLPEEVTVEHSQACYQVSQWAPGALLWSAEGAVAR